MAPKNKKGRQGGPAGRKRQRVEETEFELAVLPTPTNDRADVVGLKYSGLRIDQLKALLKQKGASTRGKKKDLLDRLVYYDLNSNFQVQSSTAEEPTLQDVLELPPKDSFKDIHAGSPLPPFVHNDVDLFLRRFQKSSDAAVQMYKCGYLQYARFSVAGEFCFMEGLVSAEMRKSVKYETHAKLGSHGEIEGTRCECTAGHTGDAHCKHVIVLLLAIADVKKKGTFTTELTCTEKLQSFHKPKAKFKGTPLKVALMKKKKTKTKAKSAEKTIDKDQEEDKDLYYVTFLKNHVINGGFNSTMPIKSLIPPTNTYAIVADHTYSCLSPVDSVLKSLNLDEITAEKIAEIEKETRGQSSNEKWHAYREGRLTASKFFSYVKGANKAILAHNSLYPTKFCSAATNHGIKYESVAIDEYVRKYGIVEEVKECGLFILQSHPFIAGSPDRLLGNDGIVEVKCPYTARKYEVNPGNQCYLKICKDGKLKLKKQHQYYFQIQGQLLVTGRHFCDFVVYTFKSCERIRVRRNEAFIDLLFCDLHDFYVTYMKPTVINKYIYRDFDKCALHDLGYCAKGN